MNETSCQSPRRPSDYFLAQLNLDPERTLKRYGDGFADLNIGAGCPVQAISSTALYWLNSQVAQVILWQAAIKTTAQCRQPHALARQESG